MTIRIGDTIKKLDPSDTYPIVDNYNVAGLANLVVVDDPDALDDWATANPTKLTDNMTALVLANDNDDAAWYQYDTSVSDWVAYNVGGIVVDLASGGTATDARYVTFGDGFTITPMPDNPGYVTISYDHSSQGNHGVIINGQNYETLAMQDPLIAEDATNSVADIAIRPNYYEKATANSYLRRLGENTNVIGKLPITSSNPETAEHYNATLRFSDGIVPLNPEGSIQVNDDYEGVVLKASPNSGEDKKYLVMAYFDIVQDENPDAGNRFVKVYLYNEKKENSYEYSNVMVDINDRPLEAISTYQDGAKFQPMIMGGVVNVPSTGVAADDDFLVTVHVQDSLDGMGAIELTNNTCFLVMELNEDSYTSTAKLEFERLSGVRLDIDIRTFTLEWRSIKNTMIEKNRRDETIPQGNSLVFGDFLFYAVNDTHVIITDSLIDIMGSDFIIYKMMSHEDTKLLITEGMKVNAYFNTNGGHFNFAEVRWDGGADEWRDPPYLARHTDNTLIKSSNDYRINPKYVTAQNGYINVSHDLTVPNDCNNYGWMLYPTAYNTVIHVQIETMTFGTANFRQFASPLIPKFHNEVIFGENHNGVGFRYDTQDYDALSTSLIKPLPIGFNYGGDGKVTLDDSVHFLEDNQGQYVKGSGSLKFGYNGTATIIETKLQYGDYLAPNGVTRNVRVWWSVVNPDDGSLTEIQDSEIAFTVTGGDDRFYRIDLKHPVTIPVTKDMLICLSWESDADNDAEIITNNGVPLVDIKINCTEFIPDPDAASDAEVQAGLVTVQDVMLTDSTSAVVDYTQAEIISFKVLEFVSDHSVLDGIITIDPSEELYTDATEAFTRYELPGLKKTVFKSNRPVTGKLRLTTKGA